MKNNNNNKVKIDYDYDARLTEVAKVTLRDRYMLDSETSPQESFARVAETYGEDQEHAQRLYDYMAKGWFTPSSPILANGGTKKGLPISCFLNSAQDSTSGILDHQDETVYLTTVGGGVGGYWGNVRSDGAIIKGKGTSTGTIPHLRTMDSLMLAWSQAGNRRGSYAAYIDISHPEIEEFIRIRKPTGGDMNRKSLNLHHAVVIPDRFMEAVESGSTWDLIDPNSNEVVKTVDARELWMHLLMIRVETGEPYIMFKDTVNALAPYALRKQGLEVTQSNLCSEITLPTNHERTAVCCLSSVNLEYFDEWRDTTMVRDLILYLDNVLQDFIDSAPDTLGKAKYSAMMSRDLGLGAMGFHSFLQKKGVPFESAVAKAWNKKMFKHIKEQAVVETVRLAKERGAAPDNVAGDIMVRNMHLLAIAPNATSSIICGTSPSIEPVRANIFTQKTLSGSFEMKNKYLDKVITRHCDGDSNLYKEIWDSIIAQDGSVQHLEFLTDLERDVFKTAPELDQMWLIEHGADRQEYICQAQSINLFFTPDPVSGSIDKKYLHHVHMQAWKKGLKTLYYLRSQARKRAETVSMKVERNYIITPNTHSPVYEETTCLSCEG